jgi:Fic family protein
MQYESAFLNERLILPTATRQTLHAISKACPLSLIVNDGRNYEEWMVDFVYTSAKIEGNTYSRVDTDNLLRLGITAGNKRYSDAKMLVNLREAFSIVMKADASVYLDEDYTSELHRVLMSELLPAHELGIVRSGAITIGASTYQPLANPIRLKEEMKALFSENAKYTDPFERAMHLHCNLAYLQFFRDGNKRTARLMQTACLVQAGVTPLFFSDGLIGDYMHAVVDYYETGRYSKYVSFFEKNYTMVAARILGEDESLLRDRIQVAIGGSAASGPK